MMLSHFCKSWASVCPPACFQAEQSSQVSRFSSSLQKLLLQIKFQQFFRLMMSDTLALGDYTVCIYVLSATYRSLLLFPSFHSNHSTLNSQTQFELSCFHILSYIICFLYFVSFSFLSQMSSFQILDYQVNRFDVRLFYKFRFMNGFYACASYFQSPALELNLN